MSTFLFPTSAALGAIEQQMLPQLDGASDPIHSIFPDDSRDDSLLIWEQMDNYVGLQQARGMNGQPGKVNKVGIKQYMMQPGVYGEYLPIDETELTRRRQIGTFGAAIDISDLVLMASNQLLQRQVNRKRKMGWDLLTQGYFTNTSPNGAIIHSDSYTQRIYTSIVPWTTAATATPLQDLRNVKLLKRGYSIRLDASTPAYANQTTINAGLANLNPADLYGKRDPGLSTINTLTGLNTLFTGEGLPNLIPFDDGYYDESGTFQLFIPNGVVVVAGGRSSGAPAGKFVSTRNANNPGMAPGPYYKVIDSLELSVPRKIDVHRGFNGGIALYFPSSFIVMKVY